MLKINYLKNRLLLWGQLRIEKGAPFLAPLSWLWGLVSFCKNFLYDRGILSQTKVGCPVVSIGNLVAGGTGKTPLVLLLASYFKNKRIAILSRGYGSVPDEPLLLARRLKHALLYVGKDRVKLAKQAIREGAELILLDDGFQYRKLYRDFDLVSLLGEDPFGKGHFLPFGFLRDSPKRLQKADAIFVKGENKLSFPHMLFCLKSKGVFDVDTLAKQDIEGKKVAIFSGIAKPHLFFKTVKEMGAEIVLEKILGDHQEFLDLAEFCILAQKQGAEMVLCTEKDFVKLSPREYPLPICFLEVEAQVERGEELLEKLVAKIEEKVDNHPYESRD